MIGENMKISQLAETGEISWRKLKAKTSKRRLAKMKYVN
jgi:hypothetical protein